MQNIGNELTAVQLLPAAAITASANGTGIDLQDYAGQAVALLTCGAGTGTTPTMDVKLQESDDDSTFTDVASGAFTQVTTADSLQKLVIQTDGLKRYIRAVMTVGGTTPSFPVAATFLGTKKVLD